MRRRVLFPPFLLVLLLLVVFGTGMRCILGSVSHVVDGDTFDVVANTPVGWGEDCAVAPGQEYRVRLIGVDTPEVYGQAECYGREASDYAKGVLSGRAVCLMRDTSCTDRYGRLLAYVWVDTDPSSPGCELFLNQELVRQGYAIAWDYPPDSLFSGVFKAAECEAYQAGRGMWSACSGLPAPTGCGAPPAPSPGPTAAPLPSVILAVRAQPPTATAPISALGSRPRHVLMLTRATHSGWTAITMAYVVSRCQGPRRRSVWAI